MDNAILGIEPIPTIEEVLAYAEAQLGVGVKQEWGEVQYTRGPRDFVFVYTDRGFRWSIHDLKATLIAPTSEIDHTWDEVKKHFAREVDLADVVTTCPIPSWIRCYGDLTNAFVGSVVVTYDERKKLIDEFCAQNS